ncbi:hypothetical protein [Novosphingobium sediminicola]|uniref:Putative dehydrogenase n=1 Tax=Novosphingobium sediminicola TaxID=563162 RepID=A0A7W6G4J2_9SPHN|nr:hypothetical protein [Novosphingobium sediminicola]MBB3953724.1 putative dehydrogenase [Novosphingobium sediminicola]
MRAGLAHRALEARLHVMLEKPPAAGLSQVDALVRASAGRTMLATWHSRESAAVDVAAAWLAARQIKAMRLNWREDVRVWHPGQDWLLAAGGFGVFDTAINAFSILTHIMPQPLTLESADLGIPANRQAPMTIDVKAPDIAPDAEYPRLYARFASLIDAGQSDVDARPLTLVADAMMLGSQHAIPTFEF